ncbi:MAG: methyltransferase domain-containing protein [Gammaproteobacteria bacterium]|nr:methyltransferase domain-containing protein [Gammaproteobacteria bacterium]
MDKQFINVDKNLYEYVLAVSLKESEPLRRLRDETAEDPMAVLQITPDQGQLLALLVRAVAARRVLEVGTYTGYSAMCMAEALPEDGQLVTCDISVEWTDVGRRYWQEAGLDDKIELRIGPAVETLEALLADGQEQNFDLAFIDADKVNYCNYYELALRLVRPGGLILVDNTLWKGRVADPDVQDADTCAIRDVNTRIFNDARVDVSVNPVGDGLTFVYKR